MRFVKRLPRILQCDDDVLGDNELIDAIFDRYNFQYSISQRSRRNIPASGRTMILVDGAKTPLEGLALLHLVRDIRHDVKLVVHEDFYGLHQSQDTVLNISQFSDKRSRWQNLKQILRMLKQEGAVIFILPHVAKRLKIKRGNVTDGLFIRLAEKTSTPILPVSLTGKPFAYPRAAHTGLGNYRVGYKVELNVAESIPIKQIAMLPISRREKSHYVRQHLHDVLKYKKPLFSTEKTIIHPQDSRLLRQELSDSELLGQTHDGHKIYFFKYYAGSAVMREIGRLRELTFRAVGEGSGQRTDLDRYDRHYGHIILWNESNWEIVGAYRLYSAGVEHGDIDLSRLYSASLFRFNDALLPYLQNAIELGRSFVHPNYWGKRSLDYLWYGIGAYLRRYPQVRYLFGPVSISDHYPKPAKDMLVYYYWHYFGELRRLAVANCEYQLADASRASLDMYFSGHDSKHDFTVLKERLQHMQMKVPTLYKQYSELCRPGGVRFLSFGVDPAFSCCLDGLVWVDLHEVTDKKRRRYIES